jgi:hypothetical protein
LRKIIEGAAVPETAFDPDQLQAVLDYLNVCRPAKTGSMTI